MIPHFSAISPGLASLLRAGTGDSRLSYMKDLYFSLWDFDEDWYLAQYEDVRKAIPNDDFLTGRDHFEAVGYFEGRLPVSPVVDHDWYLSWYPDVSAAIIEGALVSAQDHFLGAGYAEGRLAADPEIDFKWYKRRYLRGAARLNASVKDCTDHFVRVGYQNGAFPAPPK